MQVVGAYVDQIPAGARPPVVRVAPAGRPGPTAPAPAGLYVQVADARTQAEAIRTSLDLAERLGPQRPRFVRGEVMQVAGATHILMYAGPFGTVAAAQAFCGAALPEGPCLSRTLGAAAAPPAPPPAARR